MQSNHDAINVRWCHKRTLVAKWTVSNKLQQQIHLKIFCKQEAVCIRKIEIVWNCMESSPTYESNFQKLRDLTIHHGTGLPKVQWFLGNIDHLLSKHNISCRCMCVPTSVHGIHGKNNDRNAIVFIGYRIYLAWVNDIYPAIAQKRCQHFGDTDSWYCSNLSSVIIIIS